MNKSESSGNYKKRNKTMLLLQKVLRSPEIWHDGLEWNAALTILSVVIQNKFWRRRAFPRLDLFMKITGKTILELLIKCIKCSNVKICSEEHVLSYECNYCENISRRTLKLNFVGSDNLSCIANITELFFPLKSVW